MGHRLEGCGDRRPLLANIFMNWFLKHWRLTARGEAFRADVVAYADDFVILSCGYATEALAWTNAVITKRPHNTSLAWAIFDLPLRSHRAFLKVNAQHCFVLSDMSQESGEMSGVTIGTDLEKVVGQAGVASDACASHLLSISYRPTVSFRLVHKLPSWSVS